MPLKHRSQIFLYSKKFSYIKKKLILGYSYRKVCSALCKFGAKSELIDNPRQYSYLARHDKNVMELLLKAPLSDSILNPVPEPVDFASREQMEPLYEWLEIEHNPGWIRKLNEEDMKFIKGVVTVDGRLDLCKQVIGPQGIEPLLNAMKRCTKVDRILLGNNIIGDAGGEVIAKFIKSGKSPIKVNFCVLFLARLQFSNFLYIFEYVSKSKISIVVKL